jgi:hypothetical protein
MPLVAVRHIRKMRGGAQSHLLEADDGHWYVVKFRNNPQHRRILINELLSAVFLDYLKISSPEVKLLDVTPAFLAANPEVHLTLGSQRIEVEPGWHFGSQYPGDPSRTAVYDFLPDALLPKVVNLDEFRGILVFDKWVSNADGRQSVFYRANVRHAGGETTPGFVVRMIDHGFAFNGPNWDFPDSPLQGIYARRLVYDGIGGIDDFQPWLELVRNFPEEVVDCAWKRIPPEWLDGEEEAELERLLERLFERRKRIVELIEACRTTRCDPFPNWPR